MYCFLSSSNNNSEILIASYWDNWELNYLSPITKESEFNLRKDLNIRIFVPKLAWVNYNIAIFVYYSKVTQLGRFVMCILL